MAAATGLMEGRGWADLLLVAGLVFLSLYLVIRIRQRQKQQRGLSPQEQLERFRQKEAVRGELEQCMVEIDRLTRQFAGQLDARIIRLEKLLEEADKKIARLEGLVGAEEKRGEEKKEVELNDPLARSIYELADQGLTAAEIAQRLGEHLGKVELILALRKV